MALHGELGWLAYWLSKPSPYAGPLGVTIAPDCAPRPSRPDFEERDGSLRSMVELIGYDVQATNGSSGAVKDFVVEDGTWKTLYLVVDTQQWLPGGRVLVLPAWVEQVDWSHHQICVSLLSEQVENGSQYKSAHDVDPDYALKLRGVFDPIGEGVEATRKRRARSLQAATESQ